MNIINKKFWYSSGYSSLSTLKSNNFDFEKLNKDVKTIIKENKTLKSEIKILKLLLTNKTRSKNKIIKQNKPKKLSGAKTLKLSPHMFWEFKPKLELLPNILEKILEIPNYSFRLPKAIQNYKIEIDFKDMLQIHKDYITHLIRNHGFEEASRKYKECRNYIFGLIEGRDVKHPSFTRSTDINGLDFLDCWMHIYDLAIRASEGSKKAYACLNTFLYSTRVLEENYTRNIKSITDPREHEIDPLLLEEFETYVKNKSEKKGINDFIKQVVTKTPVELNFNNGSNGPNGETRLNSALREIFYIINNTKYFEDLTVLFNYFPNGDKMINYLSKFKNVDITKINFPKKSKKTYIRKIIQVTSPDLKMRDVAISDYWTQLALSNFEIVLYRIFEKFFPQIGLKSHSDGFHRAIESSLKYKEIYNKGLNSYDISDWSDRFDRSLQLIVSKVWFGEEVTKAWEDLVMTCDWYHPKSNSNIRYSVGQGMGTRGSMAIATAAYSLFVEFILRKEYKNEYRNDWYGVVGDDLYCLDPQGFIPKYFKQINLPINNKGKSGTSKGRFLEFVSRVAWDEIDVSRISGRIINRSVKWEFIPTLLSIAEERGIEIQSSLLLAVLERKTKNGLSYGQLLSNILNVLLIEREKLIDLLSPLNTKDEDILSLIRSGIIGVSRDYLVRNNYIYDEIFYDNGKTISLNEESINYFLISKYLDTYFDLQHRTDISVINVEVPWNIKSLTAFDKACPFDENDDLYKVSQNYLREVKPSALIGEELIPHPCFLFNITALKKAQKYRRLSFMKSLMTKDKVRDAMVNILLQSKLIELQGIKSLKQINYKGDNIYIALTNKITKLFGKLNIQDRAYKVEKLYEQYLESLPFVLDKSILELKGFPSLYKNNNERVDLGNNT